MKKHDIQDKNDIIRVVNTFYDKVKQDEILQKYFLHVNWDKHLPVMYDFWQNVLFYTGDYSGNPMEKHRQVLERFNLGHEHFVRWVELFTRVVAELYAGKNSKLIIERAKSIATIMEIKLLGNNNLSLL